MTVSVLVVDDSGFFRKRLSEILGAGEGIRVVGLASNGREAIDMVERLHPDVITMDYEMPVMDGISAVREIMRRRPTPVLMFSSLTYDGARVTLDALEAGAVDFLPKNFEEIAQDKSRLQALLRQRILEVASSRVNRSSGGASTAGAVPPGPDTQPVRPQASPPEKPRTAPPQAARKPVHAPSRGPRTPARAEAAPVRGKTRPQRYDVVAIGTSTGGPIALQKVLSGLPANFPAPLILVQHMPASFTPAFADRLNSLCKIQVRQAEDGDLLKPGTALLAPGGKQMMVEKRGGQARVRILPDDGRLHYRPCVDVTFGSLAKHFPGTTLGLILTGMGADGRDGARMMKETGSVIWSQDEQSSVIYGMPMAVARDGITDEVLSLNEISGRLIAGVQ
ncbi:MAG: chemotaxis response regulator protein-glutamate methylesterase [Oleiphilaceae bacterium]|nr:chemotaxis response regulator protein-glutamate methylesterase [Oleiphilaceae bacterium]